MMAYIPSIQIEESFNDILKLNVKVPRCMEMRECRVPEEAVKKLRKSIISLCVVGIRGFQTPEDGLILKFIPSGQQGKSWIASLLENLTHVTSNPMQWKESLLRRGLYGEGMGGERKEGQELMKLLHQVNPNSFVRLPKKRVSEGALDFFMSYVRAEATSLSATGGGDSQGCDDYKKVTLDASGILHETFGRVFAKYYSEESDKWGKSPIVGQLREVDWQLSEILEEKENVLSDLAKSILLLLSDVIGLSRPLLLPNSEHNQEGLESLCKKLDWFLECILPLISVTILSKLQNSAKVINDKIILKAMLKKATKGLVVQLKPSFESEESEGMSVTFNSKCLKWGRGMNATLEEVDPRDELASQQKPPCDQCKATDALRVVNEALDRFKNTLDAEEMELFQLSILEVQLTKEMNLGLVKTTYNFAGVELDEARRCVLRPNAEDDTRVPERRLSVRDRDLGRENAFEVHEGDTPGEKRRKRKLPKERQKKEARGPSTWRVDGSTSDNSPSPIRHRRQNMRLRFGDLEITSEIVETLGGRRKAREAFRSSTVVENEDDIVEADKGARRISAVRPPQVERPAEERQGQREERLAQETEEAAAGQEAGNKGGAESNEAELIEELLGRLEVGDIDHSNAGRQLLQREKSEEGRQRLLNELREEVRQFILVAPDPTKQAKWDEVVKVFLPLFLQDPTFAKDRQEKSKFKTKVDKTFMSLRRVFDLWASGKEFKKLTEEQFQVEENGTHSYAQLTRSRSKVKADVQFGRSTTTVICRFFGAKDRRFIVKKLMSILLETQDVENETEVVYEICKARN